MKKIVKTHVISKLRGRMNITNLVYTFVTWLAALAGKQKYQPGFADPLNNAVVYVRGTPERDFFYCYFIIHCYYHVKYFYDP